MNWTVTPTEEFSAIAQVNATCSDGTVIGTPLFGVNGTLDDKVTPWICTNKGVLPGQNVDQPDNEGVYPYE